MSDDILDRIDDVLGQGLLDGTTVDWDAVSGPTEPPDQDDLELAEWERELLIAQTARARRAALGSDGGFPPYPGSAGALLSELRPNLLPSVPPLIRLLDQLGVLPILERTVIALNRLLNHAWFRRRTSLAAGGQIPAGAPVMLRGMRTVTVQLTADISGFMDAMSRVGVTVGQASDGFQRLGQAIREHAGRDQMRAEGQAQLQAARHWLNHHVDDIYADLQLTRPQEEHTQ